MTATTGELVLDAVAALLVPVRTAGGYLTEAGADVRHSPFFSAFKDAQQWLTLLYVSSESYGAKLDSEDGITGNQRIFQLSLQLNVDVFRRVDEVVAAKHFEQIKSEVRVALLPPSGRLALEGVERAASIKYLGNELITEQLPAGVVGVRSRARVVVQERITH